jgi:hypothetical protein
MSAARRVPPSAGLSTRSWPSRTASRSARPHIRDRGCGELGELRHALLGVGREPLAVCAGDDRAPQRSLDHDRYRHGATNPHPLHHLAELGSLAVVIDASRPAGSYHLGHCHVRVQPQVTANRDLVARGPADGNDFHRAVRLEPRDRCGLCVERAAHLRGHGREQLRRRHALATSVATRRSAACSLASRFRSASASPALGHVACHAIHDPVLDHRSTSIRAPGATRPCARNGSRTRASSCRGRSRPPPPRSCHGPPDAPGRGMAARGAPPPYSRESLRQRVKYPSRRAPRRPAARGCRRGSTPRSHSSRRATSRMRSPPSRSPFNGSPTHSAACSAGADETGPKGVEWAVPGSNGRPPACKAGALTN